MPLYYNALKYRNLMNELSFYFGVSIEDEITAIYENINN